MSDVVKTKKEKVVKKLTKSSIVLQAKDLLLSKNVKVYLTLSNEHHKSLNTGNLAFFLVTMFELDAQDNLINPKALIFTIDQYELALNCFNKLSKARGLTRFKEIFKQLEMDESGI